MNPNFIVKHNKHDNIAYEVNGNCLSKFLSFHLNIYYMLRIEKTQNLIISLSLFKVVNDVGLPNSKHSFEQIQVTASMCMLFN